jgi:two-component sensor histidine kinase
MPQAVIHFGRKALSGLGWWALVALVFTTEHWMSRTLAGQPVDVVRLLRGEFITFLPWVLLSPFIAELTRRYPISGERRGRHLLLHGFAALVTALVHTVLGSLLTWVMAPDPRPWTELYVRMLRRAVGGHMLMYASLQAVLHAVASQRALREREVQSSKLEAQLAQAQLAVLRTQLQPHFLFNTLHAVSALMARDVTAARRVLARLSELLRQSLDADAEPEAPLREELEFLERYLEIQHTRFEDRLRVHLQIEPETLDIAVPRALLQPLVENALRHGLAPRAEGGTVEVRAHKRAGRLHLVVADDGVGLPEGLTAPVREGVGLRHTRARLRALYGEAHVFDFRRREGGGVEVHLVVPWRSASTSRTA